MKNQKKRVLIVNDDMVVGGVAKVLNNMLREIGDLDFDIDLLILHPCGEMMNDIPKHHRILKSTPFFEVCDISIHDAIKSKDIKTVIRKIIFFLLMKTRLIHHLIKKERKKIIKDKYDVEVAFKEGFCTIFVADGDSKKKINWIHVDYEKSNYSKNHMALVKKALDKIDVNVAVSKDSGEAYKRVFNLKKDFIVINNFIDEEAIREKAKETYKYPTNDFNIVTVGRLHPQKANLRMMEVCNRLNKDGLKYDFYIVGDGEEREEIEKKISEYALNNVHLLGYDSNPHKYVKNADLFLLPSKYEGVPTVVYEAQVIGNVPIVSTVVSGIYEQLGNNEYGIIIENNEDAIYEKLKEIINNPSMLDAYRNKKKELTNNITSKKMINELFS